MRIFLSYSTPDYEVADHYRTLLSARRADLDIYFAPKRNHAGARWMPILGEELNKADAVVLVLGARVGPWQEIEYYEALQLFNTSRTTRADGGRPLIIPIVVGGMVPGLLQFLGQFHCLFEIAGAREDTADSVIRALDGIAPDTTRKPWQIVSPYAGLPAMTSDNAAYFFGRDTLTGDILETIAEDTGKVLTLVGNSGVGKSSIAKAGVLAALRSRLWPGNSAQTWPERLRDSPAYVAIDMVPGEEPVRELARVMSATWLDDPSTRMAQALQWRQNFADGASLSDLAAAVREQITQTSQAPPPTRFVLYVDQGEELYARAAPTEAKLFSQLLAAAASREEFIILTSLRSDWYGHLQADHDLFDQTLRIDIPPLDEAALTDVISKPAQMLGASFENAAIIPVVAEATAKERDALPLLSFMMQEVWEAMQADPSEAGVLRFPYEIVDVSRALVQRAESFLSRSKANETVVRTLFTHRLIYLPKDGTAVRRRAYRSECTEAEWTTASDLTGMEWRLLSSGLDETVSEKGEPYVAVAHEKLLERWPRLVGWIEDQRDFLTWKGQLETDRQRWQDAPEQKKETALLAGLALDTARGWYAERRAELAPVDRLFIEASLEHAEAVTREKNRRQRRVQQATVAALVVVALFAGFAGWQWWQADRAKVEAIAAQTDAENARQTAVDEKARADEAAANAVSAAVIAEAAREAEAAAAAGALAAAAAAETAREAEAAAAERARQAAAAEAEAATRAQQEAARAERQAQRAELAEADALARADEAEAANARAQAALRDATQAANTLVFDLAQRFKNSGVRARTLELILNEARSLQDRLAANFPDDVRLQRSRSAALIELGDIYASADSLDAAVAAYEESFATSRALAERDPENTQWQRDVSISLDRIGDLRLRAGDADGALKAYEEGLAIRRALVERDPENTLWQRDVSISLNRIGDLRLRGGDADGALKAYEEGLIIARALAERDPDNTQWQRDVSISLERIGDLRRRAGDADGALKAYEEGLAIGRALAERDPDNTQWQRDVSVSLNRIGDLRLRAGDADGALNAFDEGLAIARALAERDPDNTQWQRDVSISLERIGDLRRRAGDADGALKAYEGGLAIGRALAERDPDNTQWQRDVSVSLNRIGDLRRRAGDADGALKAYEEGLAIGRALAERDPDNTLWQRDVSVSLDRIGNLRLRAGDADGALKAYEEGLAIRRALAERDPENKLWQTDVVVSLFKVYQAAADPARKRAVLIEAVSILEPLAEAGQLSADQSGWPDIVRGELARLDAGDAAQRANDAGNRAYNLLFERRWAEAEAAAREALDLTPAALWVNTNLAHALMFQDRLEEADALYFGLIGEEIGDRAWQDVIRDDFNALKEAGLTHPHMDTVEAAFAAHVSTPEQDTEQP